MKKYCPQCGVRYDNGQQRFCLSDGVLLSLPDPYRLVGNTLEGRYRIEALIGVGGFGAVYSAQQLGTGRAVAFKILKPDIALQTPVAVELFEGEAKTAARLEHENIVTIYDAGHTADGLSYIAMEWLEGRPLDEELQAAGRLSFDRAAEILRPVTAALAHAHAHRVVHRDLKPGNVMLVKRRAGSELVKVVDFGIAKVMNSSVGSTISRSIGTPQYSPPEQWTRGAQIDGRADIYALGVMLFELLTRRLPFNAETLEQLIQLKLSGAAPSLRQVLPEAPTELDVLLQRMLAREPERRPQKVTEIPALFEAAYKTVAFSQAPTLLEATAQVRDTERQRIPEPTPAPPPQSVKVELKEETHKPAPAPATPVGAPSQPLTPTHNRTHVVEVVKPSAPQPATSAPSVLAPATAWKKRGRVAAGIVALAALLGYGYWSTLRDGPAAGRLFDGAVVPASAVRTMSFQTVTLDARGRENKREQRQVKSFIEDLGEGVTLEMVEVPAGTFTMGSPNSEAERSEAEGPPQQVNVPAFWMGKYEVTQAQWRAVSKLPGVGVEELKPDPANFKGDNLPVERVSWYEVREFCRRLSRKTGREYRLPSEAEWEYAARAGTTTPFAFGPTVTPDVVNYNGNYPYGSAPEGIYRNKTVPVGSLGVANAFGLFDLHGNVWEWCEDLWHKNYNDAPNDGSAWLSGGDSSRRVLRGGSWLVSSRLCRSTVRSYITPDARDEGLGFRVVARAKSL